MLNTLLGEYLNNAKIQNSDLKNIYNNIISEETQNKTEETQNKTEETQHMEKNSNLYGLPRIVAVTVRNSGNCE